MRLTLEIQYDLERLKIWARTPGAQDWQAYILAGVYQQELPNGTLTPQAEVFEVYVDPTARRQGLATLLYNLVEAMLPAPLHPSSELSDDAVAFWLKRRPGLTPENLAECQYGPFSSYEPHYQIPQP